MSGFSGPATPLTTSEASLMSLTIGLVHLVWIAIVISIGIGFLIQLSYKIRKQETQPVYMYAGRYVLRLLFNMYFVVFLNGYTDSPPTSFLIAFITASLIIFIKDRHKKTILENLTNSIIYEPLKIGLTLISFVMIIYVSQTLLH